MISRERYRQVARLHVRCLDQGFLATLGEGFLALMYESMDRAERGHADHRGAGRPGGRLHHRRHQHGADLQAHATQPATARLGLALAPALVSPAKVRRILEIVRYSGDAALPNGVPDAELLSLAVAPEARGSGVADALYRKLVEDFHVRGVDAFRIIVGDALAPAHRFYQRMGATVAGQVQVHEGEHSKVYVHRVEPAPES